MTKEGVGRGVSLHVFLFGFPPGSAWSGWASLGQCQQGVMTTRGLFVVVFILSSALASHYEVNTDDRWTYQFYSLNETTIQFKVKANNDAHVMFTERVLPTGEVEHFPFLEIVLGGWRNTQSAIRRRRQEKLRVSTQTPGILSGKEFRGFWIKLIGASVMVGREHESVPFLAWTDPNPLKISHFGVATAYESTGQWKIDVKGYDFEGQSSRCAPQDVLVAHSPWDGSLLHVVKEACWSILTEHSCNTVDEPQELSELPPSILEETFGNPGGPQAASAAAAPAPPRDEARPKKKRYNIMAEDLKTWDEAKAACEERGQRFATVKSEAEQLALEEAIKENRGGLSEIWLAASDRQRADQFIWNDTANTPVTYNNWQRKVPMRKPGSKENCVHAAALAYVLKGHAYWFTANCDSLSNYACEIEE